MTYVLFILMLVALILVHEFGHLVMAKLFGVKVEEFSIGFPPRIGTIKIGETDYSFGWLLFGGYVRMLGENEEPNAEGRSAVAQDERSFAFKSGWSQAAITVAGVLMNIIFAWAVFVAVFAIGISVDPSVPDPVLIPDTRYLSQTQVTILDTMPGSPAAAAGFHANDTVIKATSGQYSLSAPMSTKELQSFIASQGTKTLTLTVERGAKEQTITVKPSDSVIAGKAAIGVELGDMATERLPLGVALVDGAKSTWEAGVLTIEGFGQFFGTLFAGHANLNDVSGPIGIVVIGGQTLAAGLSTAMIFLAAISIGLAVINFIPIPGLDGGRLLIILIERIKGSPISPHLLERMTLAGFALIIVFAVFVSYHDVMYYIL
ncbi:MAG: M50 family metallopeptidase [Minisyncoccia bacterium]